jgi:peptidoglycan/xylan/chitin deacetylase (PgdA/CDA1 family)
VYIKLFTLAYHDVVSAEDPDNSGFAVTGAAVYKLSPLRFREHLHAVKNRVEKPPAIIDTISLDEASDAFWLLTFDDGGVGAYLHTADILEQFGWRGHFFVTTDFIDQPGFLNKWQIMQLRKRGHVIGSHSCSHPERMTALDGDLLFDEWRNSINVLSEMLDEHVTTASLPGGYYSRQVAQAAARAGITVLFTSEPVSTPCHVDGCTVIGRYAVNRYTQPSTAAGLAMGLPALCRRQWLWWNLKKIPKKLGDARYAQLCKILRRG